MTPSAPAAAAAPPLLPPLVPWLRPRFAAPLLVIPMAALVALLLWQDGAREAFRMIQIGFGIAVAVQMLFVFARAFDRGWFELFAYVLHVVAIGAAALTVTFRLEQYPQDLLYDQIALIGLSGQLVLGILVLASGPLAIRARLDAQVLTICALIVCTAALIKFGYYIQYVGAAGGHSNIYTDGDAVRDNSPAPIRILSAGAPLIGLLALTFPGLPLWCRALGAVAIMLEFAIGIRGRPLFILLAALAIMQPHIRLTAVRKLAIVGAAIAGIVAIGAIGYYREDNQSTVTDYFWIVLESLFGIFEAGVLGAQIPDAKPIVFGQIYPLLFPSPLGSVDTIGKLLSSTYTPKAYLAGYGYSSSALTETLMIFGPVASAIVYPAAVLGVTTLIRTAITSRRTWLFLYGACVLPIGFYIWRAEYWQLAIPAIKALPFITVLLGADAYARLAQPRPVTAPGARLPQTLP
jgi:hypothetical protein